VPADAKGLNDAAKQEQWNARQGGGGPKNACE
jgi:hypothetical protein